MKRKYRLRAKAKHPFTKLTGYPVFKLSGMSTCHVVKSARLNTFPLVQGSTPVRLVAAFLYTKNPHTLQEYGYTPQHQNINEHQIDPSSIAGVKQTCGVHQCVNPDHLIITLVKNNTW